MSFRPTRKSDPKVLLEDDVRAEKQGRYDAQSELNASDKEQADYKAEAERNLGKAEDGDCSLDHLQLLLQNNLEFSSKVTSEQKGFYSTTRSGSFSEDHLACLWTIKSDYRSDKSDLSLRLYENYAGENFRPDRITSMQLFLEYITKENLLGEPGIPADRPDFVSRSVRLLSDICRTPYLAQKSNDCGMMCQL